MKSMFSINVPGPALAGPGTHNAYQLSRVTTACCTSAGPSSAAENGCRSTDFYLHPSSSGVSSRSAAPTARPARRPTPWQARTSTDERCRPSPSWLEPTLAGTGRPSRREPVARTRTCGPLQALGRPWAQAPSGSPERGTPARCNGRPVATERRFGTGSASRRH